MDDFDFDAAEEFEGLTVIDTTALTIVEQKWADEYEDREDERFWAEHEADKAAAKEELEAKTRYIDDWMHSPHTVEALITDGGERYGFGLVS